MPAEAMTVRELDGARAVYRVTGSFDRASAWVLRDRIEADPASEILLDFILVRDFSDLAVAVLAHGLTGGTRRVTFRGLRQHQLRALRYCGLSIDEHTAGPAGGVPAALAAGWTHEAPEAQ